MQRILGCGLFPSHRHHGLYREFDVKSSIQFNRCQSCHNFWNKVSGRGRTILKLLYWCIIFQARGPKKHLKRLNAPHHWMLDKLSGKFVSMAFEIPSYWIILIEVLKKIGFYLRLSKIKTENKCQSIKLIYIHISIR